MQEKKTVRRRMGGSGDGPTKTSIRDIGGQQNGYSLSTRRSGRFDKKMQDNLRTALLYLFALMTTWFLFCFLTFVYFTSSSSHPFDDHRHKYGAIVAKHGHDGVREESATEADNGGSIIEAMQKEAQAKPIGPEPPTRRKDAVVRPRKTEMEAYDGPTLQDVMEVNARSDHESDRSAKIENTGDRSSKTDTVENRSPKTDTGSCWGICPTPTDGNTDQLDYVVIAVRKYLRKKQPPKTLSINGSQTPEVSSPSLPKFAELDQLGITKVSLPSGGHQARLIMHTKDGARLVFKPEPPFNDSTTQLSPKKDACRIAGLYSSELAAYYFSLMAPIVQVPQVVGARMNVTSHVWPYRDGFFQQHSWIDDESRCFKGTCRYCRKAICIASEQHLKGSLSLWIPTSSLSKFDNPWSETCSKRGTEKWRLRPDFCQNPSLTSEYPFFASANDSRIGLLRLIDTAIFDYLIDYPDRNALYYAPSPSQSKGFILTENSKSFVNADHGDLAILAPLFQCCQIDKATWKILTRLESETRTSPKNNPDEPDLFSSKFGENFHRLMLIDPLYPFLGLEHIDAIERRLHKVIAIIDLCIEKYGSDQVLKKSDIRK